MSKKQTRRAAREAFPKAKAPTSASRSSAGGYSSKNARQRAKTRGVRALKPPSWKRAIVQGLILAVLYFLIIFLWQKGGGLNVWGAVVFALVGFIFFTIISYFVDRFTYQRKLRKLKGHAK